MGAPEVEDEAAGGKGVVLERADERLSFDPERACRRTGVGGVRDQSGVPNCVMGDLKR